MERLWGINKNGKKRNYEKSRKGSSNNPNIVNIRVHSQLVVGVDVSEGGSVTITPCAIVFPNHNLEIRDS